MAFLGLGVLAIVAIILFIAGYGFFKFHPLVGILAGIGVFLVVLGVFLSAFGGVGFITNLLNNAWIRYITVGGSAFAVGSFVSALF